MNKRLRIARNLAFEFAQQRSQLFRDRTKTWQLSVSQRGAGGFRDLADFLALSANFGKTEATPIDGDINGDRTVDFADFLLLAADFGKQA